MQPSGGETELAVLVGALLGFPVDLSAWARAGARALPTILLVPAFGVSFLPTPLRLSFAVVLSLVLLEGPHSVSAGLAPGSLIAALPAELACGTFVAITAAAMLWSASVAGGLVDHAMSSDENRGMQGGSIQVLLGLAAAVLFFELGGATKLATALLAAPLASASTRTALGVAVAGLDVGVTLAVPLLLVALVVDVATALLARELTGLRQKALAPLRALSVLLLLAALFDALLERIGRLT